MARSVSYARGDQSQLSRVVDQRKFGRTVVVEHDAAPGTAAAVAMAGAFPS